MTNCTTMYQFCRQWDDSEHDGFCVLDMIREFVGYTPEHEAQILADCRKFIGDGDRFEYDLWSLYRYELSPLQDGHVGITRDRCEWFLDGNGRLMETDFDHNTTELCLRAQWMPDEQPA